MLGGSATKRKMQGTRRSKVTSENDEAKRGPARKAAPSPRLRRIGALQDIAPAILGVLGVDKPKEMRGVDLRTL